MVYIKLAVDCLSFVWVMYSYNSLMLQMAVPDATPSYMGCVLGMIAVPESVALVIGKKFGKNNFSYFMSPKKTWEGLVGQFLGVFAGLAVILLMVYFLNVPMQGFGIVHIILIGICITIVAVLGDLIESMLKRAVTVKDSSQSGIIGTGLGGVLDKFDSFGVGWIMMSMLIRILRPEHLPTF